MNSIVTARARLDVAIGLSAVLDVAYDAFAAMLAVLRYHEERAGLAFPAFVLAAGAAANGRDWIGDAPALPPATAPGGTAEANDLLAGQPWQHVAVEVATLSQALARRLGAAAASAAGEDRDCCQHAACYAEQIRGLLGGADQP